MSAFTVGVMPYVGSLIYNTTATTKARLMVLGNSDSKTSDNDSTTKDDI